MSEPIKPGDMAHLIFADCQGTRKYIGKVVRAIDIGRAPEWITCKNCLRRFSTILAFVEGPKSRGYVPLSWLKRIDPGTLDEPTETHKELQC